MQESSFENFYNQAKKKALWVINAIPKNNFKNEEFNKIAVEYLYKNFPKNKKQIFEYIAILDEEKIELLETKKQSVKLSLENMTKNIIVHPEITLNEYLLISEIINKTETLIYVYPKKEQMGKIICFAKNKKYYYEIVIKTTRNKDENYLQSFHITNLIEIEREKRKKGIRLIYDNLS